MRNTDEQIREIFSSRLKELESAVPDGLWEAVSSKISATGAATGAATTSKIVLLKWIAASIIGIAALTAVVITNNDKSQSEVIAVNDASVPQRIESKDESSPPVNLENQKATDPQIENQTITTDKEEPGKTMQSSNEPLVTSHDIDIEETQKSDKSESLHSDSPLNLHDDLDTSEEESIVQQDHHGDVQSDVHELSATYNVVPADQDAMLYFFMAEDVKADSYHWEFGDGEVSDEMSPMHNFQTEGNYLVTLTVKDKQGNQMSKSGEVKVFIPGKIDVPTIFTPNGDGRNDYFDILEKSSGVVFVKVIIRDQQDRIVFENNGSAHWDGNDMSGNACLSGTYRYYLLARDRNQDIREKRGVVYLER